MTDKIYELDKQLNNLNFERSRLQESIKAIEMLVQMDVAFNKDLKNAEMRNAEMQKQLNENPEYVDAINELKQINIAIAADQIERDFEMRKFREMIADKNLEAAQKQYDAVLIMNR